MGSPILRVWPWCWHQRHMRHSSAGSLSTHALSQPSLPPRRKTSGWTSSSAMLPPMMRRKRRRMTSSLPTTSSVRQKRSKGHNHSDGKFQHKDWNGQHGLWGHHGDTYDILGLMNENGGHFTDLCALNQLVIGGSIFPHKHIFPHKITWIYIYISPNHVTENQINYIYISHKFRRSWRDVRVIRGADVSSDHHLLMTTDFASWDSPTLTAHGQSTMVDCFRNKDKQAAFQHFQQVPAASRAEW